MRQMRIFDICSDIPADANAICVTTNGITKRNGDAVMGAGIARSFADAWPHLPTVLGRMLRVGGNHVHALSAVHDAHGHTAIAVSFPTKHHWRNNSDPALIERSARELVRLADNNGWQHIYLPRPGCSCGHLSWDDVRARLEPILDDRFTITYR